MGQTTRHQEILFGAKHSRTTAAAGLLARTHGVDRRVVVIVAGAGALILD
jgi:hypothetical protein